jgi:DNA-binding NarL/FixJ family response regulator
MKILIADDHALFRDGMRYVLQQLGDEVEIIEAANFPEALRRMEVNPKFDLVLMDLSMPGSEGAASVRQFHHRYPDAVIVVISGLDHREEIERVMESGAVGFISKSTPSKVMLNALRLVLEGGIYLPPQLLQVALPHDQSLSTPVGSRRQTNAHGLSSRQNEALTLLGQGLSNKEIAEIMGLAEGTVKIHIAAVYQVLHISSRFEAMRVAERMGLVPPKEQ